MNLGEHLTALFNKAGVPVEDSALKELVTKVATVDISDDLVNKFNQTYMTFDAAKANPKLIGHFKAQHYNGLDDELKPLYEELEIPEDVKTDLLSENSSTKRAAKLVRKVKELTEKKAGASKGEKAELSKQIEDLNNQIKQVKKEAQEEVSKKEAEFNNRLEDVYLSQFLAGQKYASDHVKEEDFLLPKTMIQKEIKSRGLKTMLEGKEIKLQTEQGTDFFENNNKVDFKSFAEKVLADKKLTTISEPPNPTQKTTVTVTGDDPNKVSALAKYQTLIAEAEGRK